MEVARAQMEVTRAQMEGARAQMELQKTKIELARTCTIMIPPPQSSQESLPSGLTLIHRPTSVDWGQPITEKVTDLEIEELQNTITFHSAQMEVARAQMEGARAQMEAARAQMELQKTKIELARTYTIMIPPPQSSQESLPSGSTMIHEPTSVDWGQSITEKVTDLDIEELQDTIEFHSAQMEVARAQMEVTRAQMEAARTQMELQRTKIELARTCTIMIPPLQSSQESLPSRSTLIHRPTSVDWGQPVAEKVTYLEIEELQNTIKFHSAQMEVARAQMEVTRAQMEATRTQMEAARAQMELQKTKIELAKVHL
ncbi:uncharacterized protein [Panulirus ornatus]|uniref:uncharacterized protein isoform X2 n=1 Tax=Panulirus ornatus TaxID=150431 RepID=UPI003A882D2F